VSEVVLLRLLFPLLLAAAASAADPAPGAPAASSCPALSDLPVKDDRLRGASVVVVQKEKRRLTLYENGEPQACWRVALGVYDDGSDAIGPKQKRGDRKTPEGWYRTSDRPWSMYHGALTLSYPNRADADRGLAAGLIDQKIHARIVAAHDRGELPPQDTRLGSDLLIHGGGSGVDWTWGCVALEDADIDALRAELPAGMVTDVLILP
jgi:murein L,D-transpeptidase YafK